MNHTCVLLASANRNTPDEAVASASNEITDPREIRASAPLRQAMTVDIAVGTNKPTHAAAAPGITYATRLVVRRTARNPRIGE